MLTIFRCRKLQTIATSYEKWASFTGWETICISEVKINYLQFHEVLLFLFIYFFKIVFHIPPRERLKLC